MIVSCSQCGVKLKVDETKIKEGGSRLKCPKCANIFTVYRPEEPAPAPAAPPYPPEAPSSPAQPKPAAAAPPPPPPKPVVEERPAPSKPKWRLDDRKIVVGHDGDAILKLIEGILADGGYQVITASEGVDAMLAIEREKPFLAVLDVGLPRIYGFEICDRIKNNQESKDMKVILIASIYDKTRYKREPTSLYGADDYIEKHHIQDALLKKVQRLSSPGAPVFPREEKAYTPPPPEEIPVRQQQAAQMRKDELAEFPAPSSVDPQQIEAARRFARIILSDIALYNQGAVEEGVRSGTFYDVLAAELKEGRELYNSRVPDEVKRTMDYFADEAEKFIEKKRRTMELG